MPQHKQQNSFGYDVYDPNLREANIGKYGF